MNSSQERLEDSKDYAAFKNYCYDLVFQDGDTSYRRMLYFLATLFPGVTGCPMKLRPRKDWNGKLSDVFQLAFRIQAGMDIWFQVEREGFSKQKVVCLWFDATELYLLFHREVCRELGLNKSRDRAVAALVTWDERDERVKDNRFCEKIWGYEHIGVPEFDSDFYPRQSGEEWGTPYEKARQAYFQARQELYDKWKREEGESERKKREREAEEEESEDEEEDSESESDDEEEEDPREKRKQPDEDSEVSEKKTKTEEEVKPLRYDPAASLQMVQAILSPEEFKTLTEIKELTADHLVKTADLLFEKAPWLADEPQEWLCDTSVDSLLRAMFPWHALQPHFDESLMACAPVYCTSRHPRNYDPTWCIYCDECRKPIDGLALHRFAANFDVCERCFPYTLELKNLKHRGVHPFRLDLSRFDEKTVKETEQVANNRAYLTIMSNKAWAKKQVALEEYKRNMWRREHPEPIDNLVARITDYFERRDKHGHAVRVVKDDEKTLGVIVSAPGQDDRAVCGDSADEIWAQIERLY